jgi:D-sedoheptulose 7-phosphate isomerase
MNKTIKLAIQNTIDVKTNILKDEEILNLIDIIAGKMIDALKSGKKVLFCGNGGSAADAQHLAAELSGKFYLDREPLEVEALSVNTSFLTAVSNDISYNEVFSRSIKGAGKPGDILVAISTSGNSKNIIEGINAANKLNMVVVGLTGRSGGNMKGACKYLITIPSTDVARIQEAYMTIGHIICEIVEKKIFGNQSA